MSSHELDYIEKQITKLNVQLNALIKQKQNLVESIKTPIDESVQEKIELQKKMSFNGLSAQEWAQRSRSVWNDVSSARKRKHLTHGATYPEKLCDRLIEMYTKQGDTILDPFLGTGTTLLSAIKLNRAGVGIELNPDYYALSISEIEHELEQSRLSQLWGDATQYSNKPAIYQGDCVEVLDSLNQPNTIQLTLTSPPYADLIHKVLDDRTNRHKKSLFVEENNSTTKLYSNSHKDLGNMSLEAYSDKVVQIMKNIYTLTRPGGYNVWVVKDYRDIKSGVPYVDLHTVIARKGEEAGFKYHDLIVWDQNQHRRLVLLGYPSVFYVNQNHSFIVVLRKPL